MMAVSPDPDISLVPGVDELQHAICKLTATEKNIITDVLQRDEEVRLQEEQRLRDLKRELDEIKEKGVPKGEEDSHGRICIRCRGPLGVLSNRGDICPWCRKKVCKYCRRPTEKRWLCVLCYKEREIKGESGEWFYANLPKKTKHQYGSTLLKKLIRRRKSQAYKLSKSRKKSEDDSCEIEYTIAKTFGEDDFSDRQYVLVDRGSNGNISVSEGNVVSYHRHFGSEAAPLSSVVEVHSNEAAVNDVAFIGPSLNGSDSKENEAGPSFGELQGKDVLVHRTELEKSEEEKEVKLVVDTNPFLDDNEDSQTEDEVEDKNVLKLGHEEPASQSQTPPKPRRGILRSTEDLNRISGGEEILPQNESDKNSTEVVETDENGLKAIDDSESTDITEEMEINFSPANGSEAQKEMDTFLPKSEVEDVAENETWKEELEDNLRSAGPEVLETREVEELADNDEISYTTAHNEESKEEIEISKEIEVEEDNKVTADQTAEEIGVGEISASVFDSSKYHGLTGKGALDDERTDENVWKVKIEEKSPFEINRAVATGSSISHDENKTDVDLMEPETLEVHSSFGIALESRDDEEVKEQTQDLIKKVNAPNDLPGVKENVGGVEDLRDVEERPLNFKERMEFYREKEAESGVVAEYSVGGLSFESKTTKGGKEDSRVLQSNMEKSKSLCTEDESSQDEEKRSSGDSEEESKEREIKPFSVVYDIKKEHEEVEERLDEKEDVLANNYQESEEKPLDKNGLATKGLSEVPKCEYKMKEELSQADVNASRALGGPSTDHVSIENNLKSKEDVNLYEESVTSEIALERQTLEEDLQVLKEDSVVCEERQHTVPQDISVPEKKYVDDIVVPKEKEIEVTYSHDECEEVFGVNNHSVEDVAVNDQSLPDDLTTHEDDIAIASSLLPLQDQLKAESSQSITSNQSDTELYDTLRPELKVAGQILLGLKYNHSSQQFEVQVHKATDLIAVDTKRNSSDPYVKTYLLENDVRTNKKKTKAKKQTLNPVFDEIITYKIAYERLIEKTVAVSVWHNDMFGQNVFLGEAQIVMANYLDSGYSLDDPTPQQYQLAEKRLNRNNMTDVGEIVIELKYVPPGSFKSQGRPGAKTDPVSGQLMVRCVEGKNLNGTVESNPFCELRLVSVKSKGKRPTRTTDVEAKTINPYWDQEIMFDNISFNDLTNSVLEIRVLDAFVGKRAKFLGAVRLGSGSSDEPFDDPSTKECTAWQKLLQEPNKCVQSTLDLRSTLGSLKSSASLPPVLVEREEDMKYQVREKKSDSILSDTSATSFTDDASSLRGTLTRGKLRPQPDQFSLQSFGSMLSIYSDAGGYGSVPISGEMLFSIKYDNIAGVFEVHVQKAKGIAAVNKKTRASDPYVKTYLLPDKSKESKKKTNFKRKTVNPEWNEKIKYKVGEKDLMKRTLQVSIWNHEKFGHNDFLGEVQVQIQQYVKSGHNLNAHEPIWYTLQESAPVSVGEAVYKGAITVGLKYDQIDEVIGKLMVDIVQAKDLAAADPAQLSNPFVKSYLLPDRTRKSKRKSTFKKGTLNPVWNEKFEYSGVSLEELERMVLELTVWDHDMHSNDFLGGTRLGLGRGDESWHDCIGKEVSIWNALLQHPGVWVQYAIPLRDSMTSRKGMDVKIPEIPMDASFEPTSQPEVTNQSGVTDRVIKTGTSIESKIQIDYSAPLIHVGLMYVTKPNDEKKKKCNLKMIIRGARNLPHLPSGEAPSTYCRCQLKPSKMSWRTKTELFKRSSEPAWESLFEFEDVEELNTKCAEIVICDDQHEKIGMVRLGPGLMQESWDDGVGRERELWVATMENPDTWNYLMIPLRITSNEESSPKLKIDEAGKSPQAIQSVDTTQPSAPAEEKKPSAKEVALQSMGSHAASVRGSAQKDAAEEKSSLRPRNQSQENLIRTLSLIREEDAGEDQPRVKFANEDKSEPETRRYKTAVPSILVSTDGNTSAKEIEIPDKDVDIDGGPEMPTNLKKMSRFGSRESLSSMTSVYSTMSHSVGGTIPVRGSIRFGLVYDSSTNTFQVHIFKASNIAAVDVKKDISDPYVKTYLLPDKSKASKRKTKVRYKTINPEWNEIIEYRISLPELRSKTLMVSIWNYDRLGRNIFLGEVLTQMATIVDQGTFQQHTSEWYELEEMKSEKSPIVYKGQLVIALKFEDNTIRLPSNKDKKDKKEKKDKKDKKKKKDKGRIHVHVIKGEGLPAGDDDGLSDPYCKFYLLPLRQSKTKRKTPVIRRTREAFWDYQSEYDVDFDELPELGIEFLVYDWDKSSRNDFLGCARLNLGGRNGKWDDALGVEREAWQKLINEPNVRHEFVIPLRSSMDTRPFEE